MELGLSGCEGRQDGKDLLGHYGQHLDVDAVELVKAPPRSCLFSVERVKYIQQENVLKVYGLIQH